MKRILVLYYSQSGDVLSVAKAFASPLNRACQTDWREIRPRVVYPSPWRSMRRFFDVMPESVLGIPPKIEPLSFETDERFDLVILAYQVWYLTPSLPIQAVFQSPAANVLTTTPTLTLCVSRSMWHMASRKMKQLLAEAGALHIDNVVVTHQGPPLASFLTTTRALLWGQRDRLLGIFPPAGISAEQLERVGRLGQVAASRLDRLESLPPQSLLAGSNHVEIHQRYVAPEIVARSYFAIWARSIRAVGEMSGLLRGVAVYMFAISLMAIVVLGLPIAFLGHILISPWVQPWLRAYIAELKQPGGE